MVSPPDGRVMNAQCLQRIAQASVVIKSQRVVLTGYGIASADNT